MSQLIDGGAPGLPAVPSATPVLAAREVDVLSLAALGLTNRAIARRLGMTMHTVKVHLRRVRDRVGARPRPAVVGVSYRLGLLPLPPLPDGERPVLPAQKLRIMSILAAGGDIYDAAKALGISASTARTYAYRTLQNLGTHDRTHAVHLLYAWRFLPVDGHPPHSATRPRSPSLPATAATPQFWGCPPDRLGCRPSDGTTAEMASWPSKTKERTAHEHGQRRV
ncbi:LuxR C-terminal-related transcriptional regulator [Streptomyces sp. NBC_00237]|uniref:LuxR C-terminal-related transcriptional regulator n=1 Tax=Streptomyces sp. NBC_00237 TaxID=2975687 RepID=UPI0022546823|nr:LuxR C-terminal-related transcriptional regulator [Streptomyces sp. NBC_00237]MCX5206725.1 LuxR C-terminal-related transcriptional regulator [Streptomyces sp. NBC_00237]